jgi:hypothetical protein
MHAGAARLKPFAFAEAREKKARFNALARVRAAATIVVS